MTYAAIELPLRQARAGTIQRAVSATVIAFAAVLVVRFFLLIDRMAVDVLFWDQYGYYSAVWQGASPWQLFQWQHGPHRMGLGFPIMAMVDQVTGWNQRAQAFVVGTAMCLACAAALWLRRRLAGRLQWYDIAIPLLFLTNRQWAIYADVINISHGALPLLLVLLIAAAWLIANPYLRFAVISILAFLAAFTGFGFFSPIAIGAVCLMRLLSIARAGWRQRRHELLATVGCIAACAAAMALFLAGFVVEQPVPGFVFPHPRPLEYLYFMGLELAYLLGARAPSVGRQPGIGEVIYGMALLAVFSAVALYVLWRSLQKQSADDRKWQLLSFLLLFTAAFLVNSAVGRVCTGLANAMTSRYVPLLIPGVFAIYLFVIQSPQTLVRQVLTGAILLIFTIGTSRSLGNLAEYYVDGKHAWIAAYKETHSIEAADLRAGFKIFPDCVNFPIQQRLDWMEERQLSMFRR